MANLLQKLQAKYFGGEEDKEGIPLREKISTITDTMVDKFFGGDSNLKSLIKETAAQESHFGKLDQNNIMRVDPIQVEEMKKPKYRPQLGALGVFPDKETGEYDLSNPRTNIILGTMTYMTNPNYNKELVKTQEGRSRVWKDVYNTYAKNAKGTPEKYMATMKSLGLLDTNENKQPTLAEKTASGVKDALNPERILDRAKEGFIKGAREIMPLKDWEELGVAEKARYKNLPKDLMNIGKVIGKTIDETVFDDIRKANAYLTGEIKAPGLMGRLSDEEKQSALRGVDTLLRPIQKPAEALGATLNALIDGKDSREVVKEAITGFLRPEEVKSLTSRIPFQEFEQKGIVGLIPRAVAEAVETVAKYQVTYGGVRLTKDIARTGAQKDLMAKLERSVPTFEKAGVKFPEGMSVKDKAVAILEGAQTNPKVGDIVKQIYITPDKFYSGGPSTKQIASIAKQFGVSPKLITEAVKTGVFTGLPAQAVKAIQALQPTPEAIETKEPIIAEAKKYPDAKSFVGGQVETHKDIKYLDPELYDNRTDFVRDIEKLNPIPGGFNRDIAMKQINTAFELWGDKDPSKSVREILVDKVDLVEYPLGYEMDSPKEVTKPIEVIYSEGRYRLVDGRHRLAQAKFNKQKTIKATVEGETPIVNLTDTWNKAHAKPQIKPISPLKPSITAPKPPEVVKEVVAPGGSLKTAKMDILDRPLDVSEQTKYTINERTIAHGSEKQFQKNISQASEDIRNIHTPGTLRKFPLSKIAEGIERRGFVDFRGREVQDIHEIAEIASAFRHPKIEQLQTIFIKNNEIIAHQVVSSGLPDTGYFGEKLAYNIKRVADKLGADEVYLAHNHPSGDPSVSQSDAQMTASLSKKLSGKLKGHIVIDDTDYGLITIDIGGKSASAEYFSFKEPKESYRKGVYKIGKELNATSVAKIVRGFVKDNKASIVFLDIKSHILSIDNIDLEKNLYQYIEDAKKNYGSPRYVIAHKKGFDLKLKTAPDGLLDVIEIEGNKFISGSIRQPIEKPRDTGIYRIQETPEIAISEEEQKLFPKFGTEGEGFVLYKTPSEIKAMKESPALKEQQRMAKLQEAEIQRKLKLQKEKEKLGEYLAKPTPGKIKPAIHEKTGYTKLVDKISTTEYQVLKEQLRAEAKGAKIGYRVGKKEVRSLESIKKDTEATVKSLTHLGKLDLPIEYKDIIDSELESLGLLEGERPLRAKKKLAEFIEEQKAKGELIPLSESEVALADYTDLNTATLDLLKRKKDILKQIAHIGKEAKYVTLQNERIELDRVIQQTSNQIYTTTGKEPQGFEGQVKFPSQRRKGTLQSTMNKIDAYFAHQRKVEFMCRTFDGNKFGKCQKYISEPIQQAYNKEVLTNEKDLTSFRNHIKANFSDKEFDELFSKEFPIAGRKMTKQEMMGVYLNSLNEGNLERLVRGFGMSPEEISIISGKLSVKEKALANLMQRTVDGKWNAISGVKEKLTGKRMGKVEGYWPIYTDKELSAQAMLQEAQKDLFQDVLNKTFIERGFSKERVGGSAPVDLNAFSVFSNHISRVNHFISHAIPVKNVQKVITTPQIKQAITDGLSENYYKQFPVWLRSVANPKTYSMDSSEKVPAWLRKKATSAMLGLKTSVSLVQSGSFTLTVHEIGFKDATAGLLEFYKHPIENIEFIYSQSPQMKFRAKTFDRDVKDWLESRDAKSIIKGDAKKGAVLYSMIKTVDKFTTLPSWLGAYNKNMKLSNGNIEESVRFADGVARRTQPSGSAKDLSAMSKGSEWKKLFTMFYTHFSNYQNQMVSIMDTLKFSPEHPLRKAGNALTAYWWVAVAPALMAKFIRSGGKERNWQEYAKAVIKYGFSGLIGIRDVVGNIIDERYDPMTSPALALPTAVAKLGISLTAEEKKPKTIMKAVSDTVGYSTGLPTPQGWITTTGLIDLMQGTTHDLRRLLLSKYALGGKSKTETIKDKYFGATKSSIGKIQKKYFGTDSKIDDLKKKYF